MIKRHYKILLIFFSFLSFAAILFVTYRVFFPLRKIPILYPEQKKIFEEIDFEKKKNKLEIYNITDPNELKNEFSLGNKNISNIEIVSSSNNDQSDLKFRVQFAAIKNKSKIKSTYRNIKKMYPNHFISENPFVEKVLINGKGTYYRIKSFELYTQNDAKKICELLIKKKSECLISKIK